VLAKSWPGKVIDLAGIDGVVVEGVVVEVETGPTGPRGMFQYHHHSGLGVIIVPGGNILTNSSSNFWSDSSQSIF
jgi:hypothetical protein